MNFKVIRIFVTKSGRPCLELRTKQGKIPLFLALPYALLRQEIAKKLGISYIDINCKRILKFDIDNGTIDNKQIVGKNLVLNVVLNRDQFREKPCKTWILT